MCDDGWLLTQTGHREGALDLRYHHRSSMFCVFADIGEAFTLLAIGRKHNF